MAIGHYESVNGVARKVTKAYDSVNGIARNRIKAYDGVDGVARLFFAPDNGKPVILEVEKVVSNTYANSTTYTAEEFILLDIYPKTGGTVNVTYGGLTKTITDTSGAEEPNAQQVFFGTFNGVSDSVATPSSGTLKVTGDFRGIGCGTFNKSSKSSVSCGCITAADISFVEYLPDSAFAECKKLTSVEIPHGISSIGSKAFYLCSALNSVIIQSGVTNIGTYAFSGCNALTSVTIPASVTSIDSHAFYTNEGEGSRTVTMLSPTPPTLGSEYVFDATGTNKFIVPRGCGNAYKTANYWSEYANYITEAT